MATFTTWAALYAALLNTLASRNFSASSADLPGGGSVTWSSADELLRVIDFVKTQAAIETGSASLRTYAKNGGRG